MPEQEKFGVQMEEKLHKVKETIDSIKCKAKTKAETKGNSFLGNYEEDLAKLESKYDHARYKLTLLRKGGASAWHELKEGVDKAYHDLKDALAKAKEKF